MNATTRFALAAVLGLALLCNVPHALLAEQPSAVKTPPRSKNAWTLDEALKELKLNPRDTYLQYVVLQLARREGRLEKIAGEVEKLAGRGEGRAAQADLFSMFAGALAVQEGLQLDTMRGRPVRQARPAAPDASNQQAAVIVDEAPSPAILQLPVQVEEGKPVAAREPAVPACVPCCSEPIAKPKAEQVSQTQVRFVRPTGMKISWCIQGVLCIPAAPIETPGRYNFSQVSIYRLKLSNIEGRPGLEVYPTLEVVPANPKTEKFLARNAVPVEFTAEDFDQVTTGNYLVKVIYLPDATHQELAASGVDEIVSTRLEPGTDPIKEAQKRGSILLVIRMGNSDKEAARVPSGEMPSKPPLILAKPSVLHAAGIDTRTPRSTANATICRPVYETCYKTCVQTCYKTCATEVYDKETGTKKTVLMQVPYTITKQVPYTVCRMVAVELLPMPQLEAEESGAKLHDADGNTDFDRYLFGTADVKDNPQSPSKTENICGPFVKLSQLEGPTVKSHPWAKMLAGRNPEVSYLSRCVPHNFYFVEFRSVAKFLDLIDSTDQWSTFIYSQSVKDARSQHVGERLQKQLALEADPLARPFYDLVLDGLAITGSDLFIREGSDVTLLMQYRHEGLFKNRMDRYLTRAVKSRPDATRSTGHLLGVEYVHVATPDRTISVFAAYPAPGLHVRSNSKVALRRVLEAIRGSDAAGNAVQRLGETDEFKYIRTLMPRGAEEEDGFVYLSDAFIRHMVSPQLKLTERRRLAAYNHLRMIGHAAQLYRTEQGKASASLEQLAAADCCPGKFNEGDLKAPDGGVYVLSADGTSGICTRHGTVRFLTPCCEIPIRKSVTHEEAAAYKAFVDQYNQYWRTYFDPIAIRVQVQPKRVRMETIVLPLIDNTVYTMLSKSLGGEPEHLDALPVPKRNIFSVNVRLNKGGLVKDLLKDCLEMDFAKNSEEEVADCFSGLVALEQAGNFVGKDHTEPVTGLLLSLPRFLMKGLGNQVGVHVYDQSVPFDLNLATFLGQMLGTFNGDGDAGPMASNLDMMPTVALLGACTAPCYISIPVQDEKIVDDFLAQLDKVIPTLKNKMSESGDMGIEGDYYKAMLKGGVTARIFTVRVGPVKLRVHCARIGKGLYITNHASVLEDIQAAQLSQIQGFDAFTRANRHGPDLGPKAHAMVRMRARNWNQALPGFRLSWAENNRQACLCNLAPLSSIARALNAVPPGQEAPKSASWDNRKLLDYAARVYGTHHVCPDGGRYVLSADGKSVVCTVHGSPQDPRQAMAPADDSPTAQLMRDFEDLTAALTFTPEGLRAVLTIERK